MEQNGKNRKKRFFQMMLSGFLLVHAGLLYGCSSRPAEDQRSVREETSLPDETDSMSREGSFQGAVGDESTERISAGQPEPDSEAGSASGAAQAGQSGSASGAAQAGQSGSASGAVQAGQSGSASGAVQAGQSGSASGAVQAGSPDVDPGTGQAEPEGAETVKTESASAEEQTDAILAEMTLEEKVLQLFMITPEALTGSETVTAAGDRTRDAIVQYPVGGIIYFAQNLQSPEQVKEMLANTGRYYEEAGYPAPFLAVDEEGGKVARIGNQEAFGVERIGEMRAVGEQGDPGEASRIGTVIGSYLSELGFTMDFAPVADVLTDPDNKVIGNRSFGTDPALVAEMVLAEMRGLEDAGVWAVLKHYPGHGATRSDSHEGYARADKTLAELMEAELVPFQEGIREGVSFIMAAHISVPKIIGDDAPASLSPYMITDVLRTELGYDGIVVTDALNMGAISQQYTSGEAAVRALKAGVDILLMPVDFESAYERVLTAVETGELPEERIDESVRRILRVKCSEKGQKMDE